MQEVVGSNPTFPPRAKFVFHNLLYFIECEKLICKTNIKLEVLKLNKTVLVLLNFVFEHMCHSVLLFFLILILYVTDSYSIYFYYIFYRYNLPNKIIVICSEVLVL